MGFTTEHCLLRNDAQSGYINSWVLRIDNDHETSNALGNINHRLLMMEGQLTRWLEKSLLCRWPKVIDALVHACLSIFSFSTQQ